MMAGALRWPAILGLLLAGTAAAKTWRIEVAETAVYRLPFEALDADVPLASTDLRLANRGMTVPIELEDGGDGEFGAGDSLVFVGERLAGGQSWHHRHADRNVYLLTAAGEGARFAAARPFEGPTDGVAEVHVHREPQQRRAVIPGVDNAWYWAQLSVLAPLPFEHLEPLSGLVDRSRPARVVVGLHGLSEAAAATNAGLPQHAVRIAVGDRAVSSSWDGRVAHEVALEAPWADDGLPIEIAVDRRELPASGELLIDAVLLDWIKLRYAWSGALVDGQARLEVPGDAAALAAGLPEGTVAYGANGERRDDGMLTPGIWHLAAPDAERAVAAVAPVQPPGSGEPADYLIIAHPLHAAALAPLADHHRSRGRAVRLVTTEAVYAAAGHGIASPDAIRAYLRAEYDRTDPPRLRHVLLAGDASWDQRGWLTGTAHAQLPTWDAQHHEGFGASDNPYADLAGDDGVPDVALGRLPIADPAAMRAVVDKTLAFAAAPPDGAWRRTAAWISGDELPFQKISDDLAQLADERGFEPVTVYSTGDASDTQAQQQRIAETFGAGAALVHFLGHGGRFVWRTGPPDLRNASDLFGLDQVRALPPTDRLPILLSMTCTSGPFDHPTESSLAEEFLQLPDRGAVAVVAASWRIPASEPFSRAIVDALTQPDTSIGEALLAAKQAERNQALVASYNLLGDPALGLTARKP